MCEIVCIDAVPLLFPAVNASSVVFDSVMTVRVRAMEDYQEKTQREIGSRRHTQQSG